MRQKKGKKTESVKAQMYALFQASHLTAPPSFEYREFICDHVPT